MLPKKKERIKGKRKPDEKLLRFCKQIKVHGKLVEYCPEAMHQLSHLSTQCMSLAEGYSQQILLMCLIFWQNLLVKDVHWATSVYG